MSNRERPTGNLAALLCALSFATSLGLSERMEHGLNSAYIGLRLADVLKLPNQEREAIFYGALLKNVGCTACAAGLAAFFPDDELEPRSDFMLVDPTRLNDLIAWLSRHVPLDSHLPSRISRLLSFLTQCGPVVKEAMRGHCEIAELFARRLGFPEYVQRTLRLQWEYWNGKGLAYGLKGSAVPLAARILHAADTLELAYGYGGPAAARALAREQRGARFDPEVMDVFLVLEEQADFWQTLEHESAEAMILAMQPPTSADRMMTDQLEVVCERTAPRRRQLGTLTEREAEVLRLLAQGQSNPQIAEVLFISRKTVEHHLEHIYNKIGVTCRTSAVVYAVQQGIA